MAKVSRSRRRTSIRDAVKQMQFHVEVLQYLAAFSAGYGVFQFLKTVSDNLAVSLILGFGTALTAALTSIYLRIAASQQARRDAVKQGLSIGHFALVDEVESFQSAEYEADLVAAEAELTREEIDDGIAEFSEFLGESQSNFEASSAAPAAAAATQGLVEIFTALGPPPPELMRRYGTGGTGSDDGVGAGPRGKNA
ncbi:hypothetical protein ABT121_16415 [Streptomyces sp. NPDC001928]|uniref:hypothetical protein n=1 Tax=Streptomyces sp. NPDC001928 TaxID=3154404 RepID=UPI003326189F